MGFHALSKQGTGVCAEIQLSKEGQSKALECHSNNHHKHPGPKFRRTREPFLFHKNISLAVLGVQDICTTYITLLANMQVKYQLYVRLIT